MQLFLSFHSHFFPGIVMFFGCISTCKLNNAVIEVLLTFNRVRCQSISEVKQLAASCRANGELDTMRTHIAEVESCIVEILQVNDAIMNSSKLL